MTKPKEVTRKAMLEILDKICMNCMRADRGCVDNRCDSVIQAVRRLIGDGPTKKGGKQ